MYIALNPQKSKRFTTKGINLTLSKPVGFVADDIEDIFKFKIDEAIRNGELVVVPDNEGGIFIQGLGSTSSIETDEQSKGNYTVSKDIDNKEFQEVKDPFGTVRRVRKMTYTLTLPKEEEAESQIITVRS